MGAFKQHTFLHMSSSWWELQEEQQVLSFCAFELKCALEYLGIWEKPEWYTGSHIWDLLWRNGWLDEWQYQKTLVDPALVREILVLNGFTSPFALSQMGFAVIPKSQFPQLLVSLDTHNQTPE